MMSELSGAETRMRREELANHHLDASDCTDGKRVYEDTMRLRAFVEYLEARGPGGTEQ
jgi:hypothetical protein